MFEVWTIKPSGRPGKLVGKSESKSYARGICGCGLRAPYCMCVVVPEGYVEADRKGKLCFTVPDWALRKTGGKLR